MRSLSCPGGPRRWGEPHLTGGGLTTNDTPTPLGSAPEPCVLVLKGESGLGQRGRGQAG